LRLQGQTGFQDRQGSRLEEDEGGIELNLSVISDALHHVDKFWWAVSSNFFSTNCTGHFFWPSGELQHFQK
jgi:hypothetical protein